MNTPVSNSQLYVALVCEKQDVWYVDKRDLDDPGRVIVGVRFRERESYISHAAYSAHQHPRLIRGVDLTFSDGRRSEHGYLVVDGNEISKILKPSEKLDDTLTHLKGWDAVSLE